MNKDSGVLARGFFFPISGRAGDALPRALSTYSLPPLSHVLRPCLLAIALRNRFFFDLYFVARFSPPRFFLNRSFCASVGDFS